MKFLSLNSQERNEIIKRANLDLVTFSQKDYDSFKKYFAKYKLAFELDISGLVLLQKKLSPQQLEIIEKCLQDKYKDLYVNFDEELIKIPIRESGEKMVSIHSIVEKNNLQLSFNPIDREIEGKRKQKFKRCFYFREGLIKPFVKLAKLAHTLGLSIHVLDVYRSEEVQRASYMRTFLKMKRDHSNLALSELVIETNAKTAFAPWAAGHMSGAALDIQIYKNGEALEIGNKYLPSGSLCNMNFPFLTMEQLRSRLIFETLTKAAGFTIYPAENWHISFGDITANYKSKKVSKYGPLRFFDTITGEVERYKDLDSIYSDFYTKEDLA